MINANDPAYPTLEQNNHFNCWDTTPGLTKREYFAALIMQGLVANNFSPTGFQNGDENSLAEHAVKCSNALLSALEKK